MPCYSFASSTTSICNPCDCTRCECNPCNCNQCTYDTRQFNPKQNLKNLYHDLKNDVLVYFRPDNLKDLALVLVASGIMANTGIDCSIRHHFEKHCKSRHTDRFFDNVPEKIGKTFYYPFYFGAMALANLYDPVVEENPLYIWGYRSARTLFIAGLQVSFFTRAVGAGKPVHGRDSKWHPFNYKDGRDNGCSGHSFNGAIPFLTAAMMTDSIPLKVAFYAASTLPGLSRLSSNDHYFSQLFMGWAISYLTARAVYESDHETVCPVSIMAVPTPRGGMIYGSCRF